MIRKLKVILPIGCREVVVRQLQVRLSAWKTVLGYITATAWTYFNNQLNAQFLYSITIRMLHYNPRHVSSINMPIFRRTNCIITASGIVSLCKRLYSMPDESRLQSYCYRIKEMCIKLVIEISLHYDARSKKHQIKQQLGCCLMTHYIYLRYVVCFCTTNDAHTHIF